MVYLIKSLGEIYCTQVIYVRFLFSSLLCLLGVAGMSIITTYSNTLVMVHDAAG